MTLLALTFEIGENIYAVVVIYESLSQFNPLEIDVIVFFCVIVE